MRAGQGLHPGMGPAARQEEAKGFRLGEISDHRPAAARRNGARLLVVTHERGNVVAAAHERVEHGRADVAGRAGQEDPHRGRIS